MHVLYCLSIRVHFVLVNQSCRHDAHTTQPSAFFLVAQHDHPRAPTRACQTKTFDEDPREAILKHAAAAESDPYWVAPAYKDTQPVALYDTEADPADDLVRFLFTQGTPLHYPCSQYVPTLSERSVVLGMPKRKQNNKKSI